MAESWWFMLGTLMHMLVSPPELSSQTARMYYFNTRESEKIEKTIVTTIFWIMLLVYLCLKNNIKITCISNKNNIRRMKVTILFFCLHDLHYVNIKCKNLGMIEIVPHWKIGPQLLCGRIYAVLKDLFFNSKLDLFPVLKANF